MYAKCLKRVIDFILSLFALIVLSPLLLVLAIIGSIKMKGNPFFSQERPGWHERIFKLIKFRTMTNEKDKNGNLLPDEQRLNSYGKFLRSTSLDELPELFNILKGDMSIIGPRPLLIEYLPWYTKREHERHNVRPGLTGWAQVNGRNNLDWDSRFKKDVFYVDNISFLFDFKIFVLTIKKVLIHEDVVENTRAVEPNFAIQRREQLSKKNKSNEVET
jgi:lipopolysaccharide/colanic/teichoic acid biosynthesis glycosyltransferase